jgi:hypothetical protein
VWLPESPGKWSSAEVIDGEQFNLGIKMMPVLAFVPEDTVEEAFADAQPILGLFRRHIHWPSW